MVWVLVWRGRVLVVLTVARAPVERVPARTAPGDGGATARWERNADLWEQPVGACGAERSVVFTSAGIAPAGCDLWHVERTTRD